VRVMTERGWVPEHVQVMEMRLGRRLTKGETVHHLNGQRNDNRPTNLELWWKPQRAGQRVAELLAYVLVNWRSIIEELMPEVIDLELNAFQRGMDPDGEPFTLGEIEARRGATASENGQNTFGTYY
jgi:hypothetical protein